jgi:hypothetical protein
VICNRKKKTGSDNVGSWRLVQRVRMQKGLAFLNAISILGAKARRFTASDRYGTNKATAPKKMVDPTRTQSEALILFLLASSLEQTPLDLSHSHANCWSAS